MCDMAFELRALENKGRVTRFAVSPKDGVAVRRQPRAVS
jgi:hypothetical protein